MEVLDSRRRARGDFDIQLSKDRSKIAILPIRPTNAIPQKTFT